MLLCLRGFRLVFGRALHLARLALSFAQLAEESLLLVESPDGTPNGIFYRVALECLQHFGGWTSPGSLDKS